MTNTFRCTHCGTVGLELGFVEDSGQNARGYTRWVQGALEKGIFGMAKLRGRPVREIEAYRCPSCSHLELFANVRA
ncbi:hypothetical protein [Streptomyces termitum]|uniref:hypothetical protein n=1 Tax=Streptomyces termitum TaxID=67368 RepID=UPI0033BF0AC5